MRPGRLHYARSSFDMYNSTSVELRYIIIRTSTKYGDFRKEYMPSLYTRWERRSEEISKLFNLEFRMKRVQRNSTLMLGDRSIPFIKPNQTPELGCMQSSVIPARRGVKPCGCRLTQN